VSLRLKSLRPVPTLVRVRSAGVRISRPAGRPIVLPTALPTVPRAAALGSRMPATFSADRLVVLLSPIVLPIRELEFTVRERWFVADCLFVIETDGSFLPIIPPMPRPLFTLDEVAVLDLDEIEVLVELTAGCFATVGAEELRVPIELPIRERWLVVGCFFAFEGAGVLRLLGPPMREVPLERAAGCSALLGTDGLVVLIVLPIREVMLGLILLLVLIVGLFVVVVRVLLLLDGVLVLIELPIRDDMLELIRLLEFVLSEAEGLLDGVLVLIELPIRDDMLGLMRLLVLGVVGRELIDRLDVLVLGARLVMDLLELLLGARLVIDLLDVLLLGVLLVMDLLDVLLLGVLLVIVLLDVLLLGVRLVVTRLEVLLLGVRLAVTRLELRLDATLLERLDDDLLDVAFGAGAGFETCRVELLDLLDLLLLDFVLAAIIGSQNNKRANRMQETRKSEPSRRDSP